MCHRFRRNKKEEHVEFVYFADYFVTSAAHLTLHNQSCPRSDTATSGTSKVKHTPVQVRVHACIHAANVTENSQRNNSQRNIMCKLENHYV